jgi:hypothetical protein
MRQCLDKFCKVPWYSRRNVRNGLQQQDLLAVRLWTVIIQLMPHDDNVADLQRHGIFRLGGEDWRIIYITSLL